MNTLAEIETAVDALPADQKQDLLLFLAARMREQANGLPTPRKFPREQLNTWIAEDEAEVQRFCDSQAK
jgi:hypothetical protein